MEWFESIVFWHWWILAGLLLILELTAPAYFFLWLGIAAAATGLLLLVFPSIPIESRLTPTAVSPQAPARGSTWTRYTGSSRWKWQRHDF